MWVTGGRRRRTPGLTRRPREAGPPNGASSCPARGVCPVDHPFRGPLLCMYNNSKVLVEGCGVLHDNTHCSPIGTVQVEA
eukprot:1185788-Prorocentrum_minimum.AAC.1